MLQKLIIKNVALIDSVQIEFTDGLNVLSGETGAGKSVIIESLNFVLGAKADKSMIRNGESECFVKAEFLIENPNTFDELFDECDLDKEDLLIISRRYTIDGRSTVKINGTNVTVNMLKKFTGHLVDVHGQSEHFYLLKASNQLNLIDKFGGEEVNTVKDELKTLYIDYKDTIKELDNLGGDDSQRLMRLDVLNYQINEIEKADIKEDEEDQLLEIKDKLKNHEKIVSALSCVKNAITDEGGVSDVLGSVCRSINGISQLSEDYLSIYERLENVLTEIDDVSNNAENLLSSFDDSAYNIDEIEDRLSLIKSLKKKYGGDYSAITEFYYSAIAEKEKLENFNVIAENLLSQKDGLQVKLYAKYDELSDLRRKNALNFSDNVLSELKELGMSKSQFMANFSDKPSKDECKFDSANGFDEMEFLFSANLGEPLKTLSAVISGGEMSRFMLSIKVQTAKYNDISTFIFDEIDAGISGNIAKVVAQKFAKISKRVQVIAISHLPQISSMADNNLLIVKTENQDKTITTVKKLDANEKIEEITRLIGGSKESDSARALSVELINNANEFKKNIN